MGVAGIEAADLFRAGKVIRFSYFRAHVGGPYAFTGRSRQLNVLVGERSATHWALRVVIAKEFRNSRNKIDLAYWAALAHEAAGDATPAGLGRSTQATVAGASSVLA